MNCVYHGNWICMYICIFNRDFCRTVGCVYEEEVIEWGIKYIKSPYCFGGCLLYICAL